MMALQEIPLASPVPTTAPHPRDVGRQLLAARQVAIETCGFVDGIFASSIICPAYSICAQNTAVEALFCCNSFLFPYCGVGPTSCVDSTDMAASCTGVCPFDDNVVKCTQGSYTNCALTKYSISTLHQPITGFGCNTAPVSLTAYDYYSNSAGGINHAAATASQVNGLTAAATASAGASGASAALGNGGVNPSLGGSSSGSGSGSGSGTSTTSSSASSSGLSTGVIVGIVIGGIAGIAIILGLIALLCMQRRRHRRQQRNLPNPNPNFNQNPMIQAPMHSDAGGTFPHSPPVAPFPAAPAQMNSHASMSSSTPHPSSQTSSTPLTQANIAAMSTSQQPSHQPSEISPHESASQIGAYPSGAGTASVLSHGSPPTYHSNAGASNAASQEHSGLGPLPAGPQYATGAAAFPHGGAGGGGVASSSVMSPGSAFGSLPPGHAPSVTGTHT